MYQLTYDSKILFDPYMQSTAITDAKYTGKSNSVSYLDFSIAPNHPLYNTIEKDKGLVEFYSDNVLKFRGKINEIEIDDCGYKIVACNSVLQYLNHTLVRSYSTVPGDADFTAPTSVEGYFQWLIDQHNLHVNDVSERFEVGVNQGAALDKNDYILRSNDNYPTTLDEINDKILDNLGGYLFVEYKDDRNILNLYSDVHSTNSQIIDFGSNILSISYKENDDDLYTVVIPRGGTPEKKEGDTKDPKPINIKNLPDNTFDTDSDIVKSGDCVYSLSATKRYGYREYYYSNNDILDPSNLLKAAVIQLRLQMSPKVTIETKAIDLSIAYPGYEQLNIGDACRVRSARHNLDDYFMLSEMELDLNDPSQTTYTFGDEYVSLVGRQSNYLKQINSSIDRNYEDVNTAMSYGKAATKLADAANKTADAANNTAVKANDKAQKATEDAFNANTTANKAQNTANTANTTANKAQNTANSAKDTADKAQTAATEAKTTANSANKAAEELKKKTAEIDKQVEAASNAANAASAKADQVRTDLQKQVDATKTDFNNLSVGGTNLLQNTSSKWSDWIVITPNVANFTKNIGVLTIEDGLVPDTWYSSQIELEFTDVTSTEGHTAIAWSQGSVDNSWIGIFNPFTQNLLPQTAIENTVYSLKHSNKAKDINANNTRFNFDLRCDYFASGKFRYRKVKCETGNKPTDWSPAPEDLTHQVQNVKSEMDSAVKAAQSAADAAQKAADKANASTVDLDKSIKAVDAKAIAAKQAAAEAQSKAENVASDLDSANAVIEQHTTELGELTTKVSNAVKKSDSALSVSTEAKQTATEASTKAASAYKDSQTALTQSTTATQTATAAKTTAESASKTATDSLKQSSAAVQTANQISTTLRTEYQTKAAADKIYATQSSLKQTSDSITASVSKTYATKDALSALQNVADNAIESWRGTGVPTLENKPASDWTTNDDKKKHSGDLYYDKSTGKAYRFGSDDGVTYTWELNQDTDVTKALKDAANAQTSANNAQASATAANTAAGKAQSTANTAVSNAATAKNAADAAQSSANKAQGDVDKLKIDIPETYATKSSLSQTAESITANVESVKTTANSAVTAASKAQQTADGISVNLTKNYQTKSQADTLYATKASLKATSDSISAEVTKAQGTADGAVTAASKAQQTADAVTLNLSKNYQTKAQNDALYATQTSLKATSESLSANITANAKTAQSAVDKATSLEANLNGFKTTVSQKYQSKGIGDEVVENGIPNPDQPNNLNIEIVDGVFQRTFPGEEHHIDYCYPKILHNIGPYRTVRYSIDVRLVSGKDTVSESDYIIAIGINVAWAGIRVYLKDLVDGEWHSYEAYMNLGNNVLTSKYMSSYVGSEGAKVLQFRNVSIKDVTSEYKTYSTKSELTQTANSIKAEVTEVSKTANGAMSKATTVEQTANGLSSKITEQGKTLNATVTTANEAKSTADSNKATISQVSTTASDALTKASSVEQNLNGFKTTVSQKYQSKGIGDEVVENGIPNPDQPNNLNIEIVDGVFQRTFPGEEHHIDYCYPKILHNIGPYRTVRYSIDVRLVSGKDTVSESDYIIAIGINVAWAGIRVYLKDLVDGEWHSYEAYMNLGNNVLTSKYMSSYVGSEGAKVLQFRNVSIKDVTSEYKTYSTKSELTQTANSIKAEVTEVSKTANGAMSKATTVEQTANGLSSKITEQGKTLNATVTTANEAKSTADSNKATISQVSTTASDALTKASSVEQNLNGFKTTVSQTYTTKDDFNNLTIGGRNLLLNSNFSKGTDNWVLELQSNGKGTVKAEALSGFAFATTMLTIDVTKNTSGLCRIYQLRSPNPMRTDTVDTISFWANASESVPVQFGRNNDKRFITVQKGWHYYKTTVPKWNGLNAFVIGFKNGFVGTLNITNIMWEHASKASQWSPAPEDLQPAGDYSTKSYVDQTAKSVALGVVQNYKGSDGSGLATKSDITATEKSITSTVSKTYQTKADMNNYATQSQLTQTNDKVTIAFRNSQSVGGQNLLLKTSVPTIVTGSGAANQTVAFHDLAVGSLKNLPAGMYNIQFKIKSDTAGGTAHPHWNGKPWIVGEGVININIGTEEQTYSKNIYISNNNYPDTKQLGVRLDNANGEVTIREMKFERGNSMTPWTAAPEDTMNDLTNAVQNQAVDIAGKVSNDDYTGYVNATNKNLKDIQSSQQHLSDSISNEITLRESYIQFGQDASNPYMDMGNSSSPNKMRLTNTKLSFTSNNIEVASVSNDKMRISNAEVLQSFRIGNFVWQPRSDGHMALKYSPEV